MEWYVVVGDVGVYDLRRRRRVVDVEDVVVKYYLWVFIGLFFYCLFCVYFDDCICV